MDRFITVTPMVTVHPVIIFGHTADNGAPKRECVSVWRSDGSLRGFFTWPITWNSKRCPDCICVSCRSVFLRLLVQTTTYHLKLKEGSKLYICELQKCFPAFAGTNNDPSPEIQRGVRTAYVCELQKWFPVYVLVQTSDTSPETQRGVVSVGAK